MQWLTLKRFNDGLSIVILLLAFYIFLLPVLPQVGWWAKHSAPLISRPAQQKVNKPASIPADNRLVIPALGLDEHIYGGQSMYALHFGVWLRPNGSTPDKGSNTVMVGHRFTYTNPRGVFYYLDKLKPGDQIAIYWQKKPYIYEVHDISEVLPSDAAVEAPSDGNRLTLYTCTPLWSLKDRLVVVAERINT